MDRPVMVLYQRFLNFSTKETLKMEESEEAGESRITGDRGEEPKQPPGDELQKAARASLVAQWLRICLPMQGTRVRALVWEDPTCRGATGPVSHNY